ncbi:lysophospholipase-like protein 1 [Onthophagus taurus]|uniref:lysophospholipase-like protein 1 n=1 Tax=Onthophagus taurus TaxID=166361 RepID=UPI0039BEBE15
MSIGKIVRLKLIPASGKNVGTIFWFHGSGDSGDGFYEWIKFFMGNFSFPHLKCIFPTAPLRYYTPSNGAPQRVWFDRKDILPSVDEDLDTLNDISYEINSLIDQELNVGIPLNKIIVGGFSMGGSLALHTAFRTTPGLGGVFSISSFLNNNSVVYEAIRDHPEKVINTPLIMFHGGNDRLVELEWGKDTFKELTKLGVKGTFNVIPNTFHELKKNQLIDLFKWINKIIPPPKEEI